MLDPITRPEARWVLAPGKVRDRLPSPAPEAFPRAKWGGKPDSRRSSNRRLKSRGRRRAPNRVVVEVLHARAKGTRPALTRAGRRFLARLGLHGCELSILVVGDGAIRR